MSETTGPDYPDELKFTYWDKKKGSLPSGHEVGDKLKALLKKHDAVDWKLFDAGWPKAAKTAAELEQAFASRDRLYRGSVFALKKDALGVVSAAKAIEKEKGAAKPTLDAAKAITKAANGYADAVDEGIDTLKSLYDKALGALPKEAPGKGGDGDGEDDEPGSALLDPKRLVAQLKQCQRAPDRTVQFAYLDPAAKDQPAVLAMHPKMSSTSLFNKLKKETGGKTGAYGSAWVDGTSLMLQLDKPLGGLVKKVRAAVKAAGFRVAKVVLWQADGTVFEQDDEPDKDGDGADALMAGAPGGPAEKSIPPAPPGGPAAKAAAPAPAAVSPEAAAFMARLKALLEKAAGVGDASLAQQAKLLGSEAGVALRKGEIAKVNELMSRAEALFENTKGAPGTQAADSATAANTGTKTDTASEDDLDAAWQARFEATEKVYLEVMARQPADAGKLRAVMDFAGGKAEAKQYAAASQALDRLDGMLAAAGQGQAPRSAAKGAPKAPGTTGTASTAALADYQAAARACLQLWLDAKESADAGLSRLQTQLRASDDPSLQRIADAGLNGVSGRVQVGLRVALQEFATKRDVDASVAAAATLRQSLEDMRRFLLNDPAVRLCDENPFGVTVDLRPTLGASLDQIERRLDELQA